MSLLIESADSKLLITPSFPAALLIRHGPLFILTSPCLMRAVLELSSSEFSWSRPTFHLSDYWRWPKQRVATTQLHRPRRILNISKQLSVLPQTRGDLDVAPSKVRFRASHLGWSWLIGQSRTDFRHHVEQLPDTQITLDTTYLHSVSVAGEFLSIILAVKSIFNNSYTLCSSDATKFHSQRDVQLDALRRLWNVSRKWRVQ